MAADDHDGGWGTLAIPVTIAVAAAALNVHFGVLSAFLYEDDFAWLNVAALEGWSRILVLSGRAHFYRPVVEAWFILIPPLCQFKAGCLHAANLLIHSINCGLCTLLVIRVTGRRRYGAVAGLFFISLSCYSEAVVWISAITMLLGALFWLASAHCALSAYRRRSTGLWCVTAVLAAAALFSHESMASLIWTIPILIYAQTGETILARGRAPLLVPLIAGVPFALATWTVNQGNYVFREGHYQLGLHAVRHTLDYISSLYVGPHGSAGYLIALLVVGACFWRGTRLMRTGLLWILLTLIPYLGFTWGNVSRYLYLPGMGFALLLASSIFALDRRAAIHYPGAESVRRGALTAMLVFLVARFALFSGKAVADRVHAMEAYREYSDVVAMAARYTAAHTAVHVPPPRSALRPEFLRSVVQWTLRDPAVEVVVDNPR